MHLLALHRKLRSVKREYQLQIRFQQFFKLHHIDQPRWPEIIHNQHFKFIALSLRKQLLFATELVLLLLAQDSSFQISGKVRRSIEQLYSKNQIKQMVNFASSNWDKLKLLDDYPNLAIDQSFINASCIALMKIIFSNFHNGLALPYLLQRYHNYVSYPTVVDQFWRRVSLSDISIGSKHLLNYYLMDHSVIDRTPNATTVLTQYFQLIKRIT
jgi:hypothetical protein